MCRAARAEPHLERGEHVERVAQQRGVERVARRARVERGAKVSLDRVERGILLAMTIPIVAIGVYPNPVLRRIEPAVLEILYQMERRAQPMEPSVPEVEEGSELAQLDADGRLEPLAEAGAGR